MMKNQVLIKEYSILFYFFKKERERVKVKNYQLHLFSCKLEALALALS
jgi:hypothetical protein